MASSPKVPPRPCPQMLLALTTWPLQSGLIQSYTLPYLRILKDQLPRGARIRLVTFEPMTTGLSGPEVARTALDLQSEGIDWQPERFRPFGPMAALAAVSRIVRLAARCLVESPISIHSFATPAGALGYILSRITGTPLVLDSFEPHAEAMVENGTWPSGGLAFRVLIALERLQADRAQAVIAASAGMKEYAARRLGIAIKRFFVKPACVDLDHFRFDALDAERMRGELGLTGKVVALYAGKTGGIYLEKEIFSIFRAAESRWGDSFRAVVLTPDPVSRIESLARAAGFDPSRLIIASPQYRDMPTYLSVADFALTPVKPVPTKRYCTPIKDGEYWAMGLPVIITAGISDDSDVIEARNIGAVLMSLSPEGYSAAIEVIANLLSAEPRDDLRARIRATAVELRHYGIAAAAYRSVYADSAPPSAPAHSGKDC